MHRMLRIHVLLLIPANDVDSKWRRCTHMTTYPQHHGTCDSREYKKPEHQAFVSKLSFSRC